MVINGVSSLGIAFWALSSAPEKEKADVTTQQRWRQMRAQLRRTSGP